MIGWILTGGILLNERAQEIESGYDKLTGTEYKKPSKWMIILPALGFLLKFVELALT